MKTRDIDIRTSLHQALQEEFGDIPETIIVDELALCQGESRIDVAVVNGSLHGYEIKSESDTLERLPKQIDIYNRIFDTVTIITGECHLTKTRGILPDWWGILRASKESEEKVSFFSVRNSKPNPEIEPFFVAQLLWREEALELLKIFNLEKGCLSKPKRYLWEKISKNIPLCELQSYVRQKLKTRKNWRVD